MPSATRPGRRTPPRRRKPLGPPLYLPLDPPFVVNFQADQLVRFLQVAVQVMSRDPKTLDLLKNNDPVVRNDLLHSLRQPEIHRDLARPRARSSCAATRSPPIRKDITQAGGDPKQVEAVYFTSFVMQ